MDTRPVVFIAFEEQDNLGIGYLASVLLKAGYPVKIIDFRMSAETILERLQQLNPLLVGFSVIFQHYIDDFRERVHYLRSHGITCHFTAGGHYPSLRYKEMLECIPDLDSVVMFEGEHTILELVQSLAEGKEWRNILGIAYRSAGQILSTGLRPLENDLDVFPPPLRQPLREYAFGKKFSTILAGRGCVYNCIFCSIREFYSQSPGSIKRVRRPEMVVREMELLAELGCSIFMFQDDDFPLTYQKGSWLEAYLDCLSASGLQDKVLWKINCRPDEVSYDTFAKLKEYGLFLVYLGIESGSNEGLAMMHKHITVDTSLQATSILKDLGIIYDYGFMLFDPHSTFASVAENLDFLDRLCGDGSSPITFCKMLPYAGTEIERTLIKEGRLLGSAGREDYRFTDPDLDRMFVLMVNCFADWIGDHAGLLNLGRWVRDYLVVYQKYISTIPDLAVLEDQARIIIAQSNRFFTQSVREMISHYHPVDANTTFTWAAEKVEQIKIAHQHYVDELTKVMNAIEALPLKELVPESQP